MLAGHDPSTIEYRRVIDVAWALVTEIYGEYGMKFQEANEELHKKLYPQEAPQRKRATKPDDAASMAALQAMMKNSDFGGPKG